MTRPTRPVRLDSLTPAAETVPGDALIVFRDVSVAFEDAEILRGISFEVAPGETKVLLGESGSGKTLIMKMAAGLMRPDSGRIWIMGHELGEMSENELLDFRRNLGFVFQESALFDSLTVGDNVAFRLREEEHISDEEIDQRVRQVLRFVELEDSFEKYPAELSGGMRRRVSIARALIDKPPVVFYDSPTAGLDPVTSQTIINLILRGRDLQGVTSLLATHRLQDAFGLAHYYLDAQARVVRLANGDGSPVAAAPHMSTLDHPTNILVLRGGEIYFQNDANTLLHSTDAYLKRFLASAE
jgi:phospholipid/cholesterol/gamma-HCH transport system ATP-binding protein